MLPREFRKQQAQPAEVRLPESGEPVSRITEESVTAESSTEGSTPTPAPTPLRTID